MKKIRSLFAIPVLRNSAIMFAGNMGANVMAFLFHLIVGRILGREHYGELAAIFSLFYILNVPSTVLQTVLVKFFSQLKAQKEDGQAKSLFISLTKLIVVMGIAGGVISFIVAPFISNFLHLSSVVYFYWLYLIFITSFISIINTSVLLSYQLFFALALIVTGGALARLILGVLFAGGGVGAVLVSNVISNIAGYVLFLMPIGFLLRKKSERTSLSKLDAVKYSIPAMAALLGLTLLYSQDVLWVKHFFSASDAGIYASVSVIGKIIFFASSSVAAVAFPTIVERKTLQKTYTSVVYISLAVVAAVSLAISAAYFLFPSLVVTVLFGNAYMSATQYLWLFGIFISFFSLSNLLTNVFLALEKTRVWIFTFSAAVAQSVGMAFFHQSLMTVIYINIMVLAGLFVALLLYYRYGEQKS